MSFTTWLISLSIMLSSSIHAVAKGINNNLTVTRGRWEGIIAGKGAWVFRNNYKGHMDKIKREWKQEREEGMPGVGGVVGGKCRQLYLNNKII